MCTRHTTWNFARYSFYGFPFQFTLRVYCLILDYLTFNDVQEHPNSVGWSKRSIIRNFVDST